MTKLSRDLSHSPTKNHVVFPVQAFRRNLKKLNPLFNAYLAAEENYNCSVHPGLP